jgi:hypothetical protein
MRVVVGQTEGALLRDLELSYSVPDEMLDRGASAVGCLE